MRRLGRSRVTAEESRNPDRARAAAIALLARRIFASGELRRKLTQQGYAEEVATGTVEELIAERVLNDARFAGTMSATTPAGARVPCGSRPISSSSGSRPG